MIWIGWVIGALAGLIVGLLLAWFIRGRGAGDTAARLDALKGDSERIERVLREEQRAGRGELAQSFEQFAKRVGDQLDAMNAQQRERLENFANRLSQLSGDNERRDRKSTRLDSSHVASSYAVCCLKKKNIT